MAEDDDEASDGSLVGSLPLSMESNPRITRDASTRSMPHSLSKKKSSGSRSHRDIGHRGGLRRRDLLFFRLPRDHRSLIILYNNTIASSSILKLGSLQQNHATTKLKAKTENQCTCKWQHVNNANQCSLWLDGLFMPLSLIC